jgi:DNA-binding MarR family transcriptional regulator
MSSSRHRPAATDDVSDLALPVFADRVRMVMVRLGRQLRRNDPTGPSITLHSALATLADHGELAIGELAEAEHLPSSAATRLADQLEEAGLAVRRRNPHDRRSVYLTATTKGRRLVDGHRARGNAWLADRLAQLGEPQRRTLVEAMSLLEAIVLGDEPPDGIPEA